MNKLAIAALAAGLAVGSAAAAQERPTLYARWDFLPYAGVDNPQPGFEQTLQVRVQNPKFEINAYPRLAPLVNLIVGARYSGLIFSSRGATVPTTVTLPENIHDVSARLGVRVGLGGLWNVEAVGEPGLNSDFKNVDADHFRFEGGLTFNTRLPGLGSIGFGGLMTNDFGEPMVLPSFNLDLVATAFRTRLDLPRSLGLWVMPVPAVEFGIAGGVTGGEFEMGELAGAPNAVTRYSALTVGPSLNIRLGGNSYLSFEGGLAANRRLDLHDATATATNLIRTMDLQPGPYLTVTLDIRPSRGGDPVPVEGN